MGNHVYRPFPRRTHYTEEGQFTLYDYSANQIIGWRQKQEDRYVCLPKFYKDLSLFAVYDGHGGEEVAQYLQRFLHKFIYNELVLHGDPELALYLSYLCCDNSLRDITEHELFVIQKDLELEIEVPEREERRKFLFGPKNFAGTSRDSSASVGKSKDDSIIAPGTSKESPNMDLDDSEVVSTTVNQIPSIYFLTTAPIVKEDESDEEYDPEKDNINYNIFESMTEGSAESEDSSDEEDEDSSVTDGEESVESKKENKSAEQSENPGDETKDKQDSKISETRNHSESSKNPVEFVKEFATTKEKLEAALNKEDEAALNKEEGSGLTCGSTATVLLLNEKKGYLASVGDSRCVACINGQAVELTKDHKPMISEEYTRIINAGGTVSEDNRLNGHLDMSRAFGDFVFKQQKLDEPFQLLSCEPYVTTVDVTPDLEFIVIASDGIWNTMDSINVIDYLKNRMQDTRIALKDICGELFEEIIPSQVPEDGIGSDNMTAIILKFKDPSKTTSSTLTGFQEIFKYNFNQRERSSPKDEKVECSSQNQNKNLAAASSSFVDNNQKELNMTNDIEEKMDTMESTYQMPPSPMRDNREQLGPENHQARSQMDFRETRAPFSSYDNRMQCNCVNRSQRAWFRLYHITQVIAKMDQDLSNMRRDFVNALAVLRDEYCPQEIVPPCDECISVICNDPSTSYAHSAPNLHNNVEAVYRPQPMPTYMQPNITPGPSNISNEQNLNEGECYVEEDEQEEEAPVVSINCYERGINLSELISQQIFKPANAAECSTAVGQRASRFNTVQNTVMPCQNDSSEEDIPVVDLSSDEEIPEVVYDTKETFEKETELKPAGARESDAQDANKVDEELKQNSSDDPNFKDEKLK